MSMPEYICPLLFVQNLISVVNPKEVGNNNSFLMSVTNDVVFELYHCMKRYNYFVVVGEK